MTYKTLKRQQLSQLLASESYQDYLTALKSFDPLAFGDVRNLLYDTDSGLGTNILTNMVTAKNSSKLISFAGLIKVELGEGILRDLLNVRDAEGSNVLIRAIQRFPFSDINHLLALTTNPELRHLSKGKNALHSLFANRTLTLRHKSELSHLVSAQPADFSAVDHSGNYPLNYLILSLSNRQQGTAPAAVDDEELQYIQVIIGKTDLTVFTDTEKYSKAILRNEEEVARHEELRRGNA